MRYFMLFCFMFLSVVPFITSMLRIEGFNYSLFPMGSSFLMYPILGWMICNDNWFDEHRKTIYLLGVSCMVLHYIGIYVTVGLLHWSSKVFQNVSFPTDFIIATAVFLFFKNHSWNTIIGERITSSTIAMISSCSLGIYLVQNLLFILSAYNLNLLNNHYYGFILTYIIGLVIVMVMKRIPIIKNIVP